MFRRISLCTLVAVFAAVVFCQGVAMGQEASASSSEATAAEQPQEGPPLPLHTIEGVGGLVLTPTAYLVNPGPEGTIIGKPSVSTQAVWIGDKDFQVLAATWTLFRRLELGYAVNRLGLDDFDGDVRDATGLDIATDDIYLHHFNARLNLLNEHLCECPWIPSVTVGAHYKYNADIYEIDRDLGGVLTGLGYNDNDGLDFTLTASKTVTCPVTERPVMLTAGARASKAAQYGLVGFTDDYIVTFEGSILMLVTDRLAVGTEYRQKGDDMGKVEDLLEREDDWWDVHAAYVINNNATVYAVAGNAGGVLNHTDENFFGGVLKYEF